MASTESIERDSTPEPAIVKPVYGLLRQVSKKSGAEGQTIPINATVISLGRDPECDIRVFHESVSRRHVELSVHALPVGYEIKLKVIGRAGITYRPATADPVKLPTGTIQTLVTGDRFSIQKFTFSFQSVDPAAYLAETLSSISTPLPAQSSTPSTTAHHPSTPTPTPSSPLPQRVPAKIALSTPKGRMSLLKHTVLQSARKQWIAQKPSGLEAAMEDGQIEVRRKSTSPTKARASMSIQHEEEDDEESDEEDAENAGAGADHQEEITGHDLAAQQAEDSYESHEAEQDKDERVDLEQEGQAYDEDSAEDSLEADLSLDMAEDDEEIPIDPALLSENDAADYRTGDVEEGAQSASEAQSMEGEEYAEEHEGYEDEQAEGFTDIPIGDANGPTTPRVTRPLDAFYTPQVRHLGQAQQPRRSLAGIGAPAWRPAQYSAPVNPLASPAVRLGGRQVKVDQGAEVKIETPRKAEGSKDVGTPVRIKREEGGAGISAAQLAEMRKRRQSLGTPRALPAAPASFKTPVPSFSFSKQIHPALAGSASTPSIRAQPLTPSRQTDLHDAPPTPMQNIRNQIDALRLQAEERSSRRASVGLNSGATAGTGLGAGSTSMPVLSFATPARTQRYAVQRPTGTPMPLAPMLEAEKGNSSVSSINLSAMTTPTKGNMGTPFRLFKGEGTRSVAATPTAETDDAGAIPSSASPKAPSRAGTPGKVRQLVPSPSVFSTPASKPAASARHDPEEQTFKATAPSPQSYRTARTSPTPARSTSSTLNVAVQARQETQTPDYSGLKHMLHNQAPAATPEFKGIRDMLHRRVERSSVAGATRNKQGGHELAAPTYTGVRQLCPRLPAVGTPEMGGMGEMFASPSPTPRFQAVASAPASPQLAQVNKGKGKAEEGGSVEKEIIVSPVKNWLAVRAEQVNEESLAEEEEEEEEEEAREERAVETEYEHDQVQDDASEESSEEEQEEIEYRSPIVPRRTTRSSPIKLAAASTDGPAVKLLQSNASLSLASRSGSTSSRASRQASKSCSPSKAVDEEKEERASTVVQVANTVSRSRSTRTRTASPVKAVEPVDVNDPEESEEEQEEIEPPRRSQPASRSTRTASGRGAAIPEPTRTSAEEHPTGVASRSTRTVPVRTKVKTEPASTTNPAPARSTRKKAESVVAAAEALGETGVQGTVSRAPRGRAAAGKAVASAKIKTEPRAAEEEEEVVQVKETKSAPVRKTRTAAAATATASTATAPAPSKTSTSAASRTTRATRATRSKVFDTAAQEEKENVEERPSRSTRSRRA